MSAFFLTIAPYLVIVLSVCLWVACIVVHLAITDADNLARATKRAEQDAIYDAELAAIIPAR